MFHLFHHSLGLIQVFLLLMDSVFIVILPLHIHLLCLSLHLSPAFIFLIFDKLLFHPVLLLICLHMFKFNMICHHPFLPHLIPTELGVQLHAFCSDLFLHPPLLSQIIHLSLNLLLLSFSSNLNLKSSHHFFILNLLLFLDLLGPFPSCLYFFHYFLFFILEQRNPIRKYLLIIGSFLLLVPYLE